MHALHLAAALLLPLSVPAALPAGGKELAVHWRGKALEPAQVAVECGPAAAAAVDAWFPWADAYEYGLDLSDDGRVLLLTRGRKKAPKQELALVAKTCAAVNELLAAGAGTETAVLVQARDAEDYGAALDRAVVLEPYLAPWAPNGRRLAGFVLSAPLCAAWIEQLDGQEEWDPRNELVHRLAQLLVLRAHGELPFWLLLGIAWHVEEDLLDGIWCFPYRDEFVFNAEHGAWGKDLQREFRDAPRPFFADLATWRRGRFDPDRAREAFGLARFAARYHTEAIAPLIEELAAMRRERGRIDHGDGTWELIPGWEPSVDDQRTLLARHLGADFEEQAGRYFAKGKRYKPAS